jgi:uncharacterized radical SAM protein YgiQ
MERDLCFLPVCLEDLHTRGWDNNEFPCDFVFISGDAYVDHPSFATALLSRLLEAAGYRVGIIPQPKWDEPAAYTTLGRPRLAFLVGAGNMDSMVAHYTSTKRLRSEDAYSPGGKAGFRPDRALIKYTGGVRAAYKNVPVIIGGIEASLRRFAHYDYWSDTVRRSILLDSKADILVYGCGERAILEIARRLSSGEPVKEIRDVRGTCVAGCREGAVVLPGYLDVKGDDPESKRRYAEGFMLQRQNSDPLFGRALVEESDGGRWVLQNPPALPLESVELDRLAELPFTREVHPMYEAAGGIPALKEVQFSLVSNRGCFGGCAFCAITFHQGRAVRSRSKESLVREALSLTKLPGFKGYIHDVGGPTANFCEPACERQRKGGFCGHRECLFPEPCPALHASHAKYLETLAALREVPGVKKVFIRSGVRFDSIALDTRRGGEFLETLCRFHVSGQLKVAPEHVAKETLRAMGKGGDYADFCSKYAAVNRRLVASGSLKKPQYLIPYFISGHPGCTMTDAVELALFLKKQGFVPDQVQDFYPTPGTLSTTMYHTGLDPRTGLPIHVPGAHEKRLQRALLQFNKRENRSLALEALREAGREDLVEKLLGRC